MRPIVQCFISGWRLDAFPNRPGQSWDWRKSYLHRRLHSTRPFHLHQCFHRRHHHEYKRGNRGVQGESGDQRVEKWTKNLSKNCRNVYTAVRRQKAWSCCPNVYTAMFPMSQCCVMRRYNVMMTSLRDYDVMTWRGYVPRIFWTDGSVAGVVLRMRTFIPVFVCAWKPSTWRSLKVTIGFRPVKYNLEETFWNWAEFISESKITSEMTTCHIAERTTVRGFRPIGNDFRKKWKEASSLFDQII